MVKPISVSALTNLRIKVVFSDGAEGSVDLSDLAGQGVFKAWEDEKFFAQVHVGPGRQIRWNDEIELCPDAIYLKLTGKTPEDLFPNLRREPSHAGSSPLLRYCHPNVFCRSLATSFPCRVWRARSRDRHRPGFEPYGAGV